MRSEQEMMELILRTAEEDERILAVYMNGSRTNPNAPKDIFQDYDIGYVVEETASFCADKTWIGRFGEILYMQYPDDGPNSDSDRENCYGWLMQFTDGNRLDLHVETVRHMRENILKDKLCRVLLDKKGILPPIPPATDEHRWVRRPTEEEYLACCNEFWWCTNNLAKGLWRDEMSYVQDMANFVVRKELERMLSWKAGILTGFTVSVGKSAKYLGRFLPEQEYRRYLDTYFGGSREDGWRGVMTMCTAFEEAARWTAGQLEYTYNEAEGNAAKKYLEQVRGLPRDAVSVFD